MGPQLRSALLAGFIASTIWMFITVAVAVDGDKSLVLVGGVLFLVGTTLITAVVASVIGRRRPGAGARRTT